jgi:hypothetical protein
MRAMLDSLLVIVALSPPPPGRRIDAGSRHAASAAPRW